MILDEIGLDNIQLGCTANNKDEVLAQLGQRFKEKGAVSEDCTEQFKQREKEISTFLGNGIVLPHLPKVANNLIVHRQIEILQFPDGIIWDRSNVMFIAIGVIARNQEHIEVLKSVAQIFSNEVIADALSLISNKDDFLKILKRDASAD